MKYAASSVAGASQSGGHHRRANINTGGFLRKGIGLTLLVVSVTSLILVCFTVLHIDYWLAPPYEKFKRSWAEDVLLLEKSKSLPKEWDSIREIAIKSDNSPAQDWIAETQAPITVTSKGNYRLDVFVIHWLEGYRYGVVLQYNLVDLRNQNTIWELGRTLKLGWVY